MWKKGLTRADIEARILKISVRCKALVSSIHENCNKDQLPEPLVSFFQRLVKHHQLYPTSHVAGKLHMTQYLYQIEEKVLNIPAGSNRAGEINDRQVNDLSPPPPPPFSSSSFLLLLLLSLLFLLFLPPLLLLLFVSSPSFHPSLPTTGQVSYRSIHLYKNFFHRPSPQSLEGFLTPPHYHLLLPLPLLLRFCFICNDSLPVFFRSHS